MSSEQSVIAPIKKRDEKNFAKSLKLQQTFNKIDLIASSSSSSKDRIEELIPTEELAPIATEIVVAKPKESPPILASVT